MINPYRWNQINLDLVYGRQSLMVDMLKALPSVHGNSFGITGARRMGKTTLLRAVERDLRNGAQIYADSGTLILPVYLDGLTLPRPLTAQVIWGNIFSQMEQGLAYSRPAPDRPLEFSDFVQACSSLFNAQEKVPKAIVIFDEIEHVTAHPEWAGSFFANWRALLSNYPEISGHISAVFSGAREMSALQHDIGSPLMDILEWKSLRSLDIDETTKLMTEPTSLSIEDDVFKLAFDETGGHPMILQYIMQKAVDKNEKLSKASLVALIGDFESSRGWQFSEWWNKYCDSSSQVIYSSLPDTHSTRKVATYAQELGGYQASKAIEILQHVGIAELDKDNIDIKRRCRMFTRWATLYSATANDAAFDSQLANQLGAIDAAFRAKYLSAWAIYQLQMPNYSGAVSEARDLVTQVLHKLAPNEAVEGESSFKFEKGLTAPTRRQRVMYIFGATGKEQGKAVASEDELLEARASQLAGVLSASYANASALTHTTASRSLAFTAIKQAESILAQLMLENRRC